MRVVKFINKFFAIILSFVFAACILFMLCIVTAKTMLTEESISRCLSQTNIFEITSNENSTLQQSIITKLETMEISEDITEKVLESEELNELLSEYIYNYINYILFNETKKDITSSEIVLFVENEYLLNTGTNLTLIQKQELEKYVNSLTTNLNSKTPDIYELENMGINIQTLRHYTDIFSSQEIIYILGLILILLYMSISVCLWSKKKALRLCSAMLIIDGILILIGSILEVKILSMFINSKGMIEQLVITIADKSFDELFVSGVGLMAVGIVLLTVSAIMFKKEKQFATKNSEKLLTDVIQNEIKATNQLKEHIVKTDEDIKKIEDTLTKIELEKVFLEAQKEQKSTEKLTINSKTEIPEINIKGDDFVEKDYDDTKIEPIEIKETKPIYNEEKMEIVAPKTVEEEFEEEPEEKEIEIVEIEKIEEEQEDEPKQEQIKTEYEELDDRVEEIVKEDIEVPTFEEINLNVVSPKKGKEIEVKIETLEEEEEIEIL